VTLPRFLRKQQGHLVAMGYRAIDSECRLSSLAT
jgi:hypothetical protein